MDLVWPTCVFDKMDSEYLREYQGCMMAGRYLRCGYWWCGNGLRLLRNGCGARLEDWGCLHGGRVVIRGDSEH
jgi:hypothetical protein